VVGGRWPRIVFNRSDEFSSFPEVDHDLIAGLEQQLLATSDSVIYVNHELQDKERELVRDSVFLGHGVDFHHFADAADRRENVPVPERLAELARPLIGFYGALDDFTVDLDLFVAVARAFPDATVLVIGPQAMDIDKLVAEPNVAYLGPIPYADLPAYAAWFDVGLMPWLQNEWIRRCNPIKLKEYLAVGFPVVSTPFPELAPYTDVVRSAAGPEAFVEAVREALDDQSAAATAQRRAMVEGETWDAVAERAGELLGF
jgi:glycosyltransferase involved in cell wall biosynthesis